jgi:delta14-sterol reductase
VHAYLRERERNRMDLKEIYNIEIRRPDLESIIIFASVIVYSVIATIILPGEYVLGAVLKNGQRIPYKVNGLRVYLLAIVLFIVGSYYFDLFPARILHDHYGALLSTDVLFTLIFSLFLYLRAFFWIPKQQANFLYSPYNFIMNFWVGSELNPHIFGFELKLFAYRPGFILLTLLNISNIAVQYEKYGKISLPMLVFQIISFWYAVDAFWFEKGLIFMFDIIEENFGFMLVMGDLVWIPFVFTLQSLYLIDSDFYPIWYYILTMLIFFVGYYIFRESNYQKFIFRQSPRVYIWGKPADSLLTKRGTRLMVSGWWGIARKINYLGDILIAISMSMPCGFNHLLPWLYPIYLTTLLIHRAHRDDKRCKEKYGEDWDIYCKKVPYMIIPGVY